MSLKVADSRKRNRLQDREDVAMDGDSSNERNGSQQETNTEEPSKIVRRNFWFHCKLIPNDQVSVCNLINLMKN